MKKKRIYATMALLSMSAITAHTLSAQTVARAAGEYETSLTVENNQILTGTPGFDANDSAGNDSSASNNIVRNNDSVIVPYKVTVNNPDQTGNDIKVEVKTVVNGGIYEGKTGAVFAQGQTSKEGDTVVNLNTITAKVGSSLSGRTTFDTTSYLPNGHKLTVDVYVRVLGADGQPLSEYVKQSTKELVASSKVNVGIGVTDGDQWDKPVLRISEQFESLSNSDVANQMYDKLIISLYSKSFRDDNSLKGVYITEDIEAELDVDMVKQVVEWHGGEKVDITSGLRFETYGTTPHDDRSYRRPEYKVATTNSYFSENNLDNPMKVTTYVGGLDRWQGGRGVVVSGQNKDNSPNGKNNLSHQLYNSGVLDVVSRNSNLSKHLKLSGIELGDNPTIYNNEFKARNLSTSGIVPLSTQTLIVSTPNEYGKGGAKNPDTKSNTLRTEFEGRLTKLMVDGKQVEASSSAKATTTVVNEFGDFGVGTVWVDPVTSDGFNGHQPNDSYRIPSPLAQTYVGGKAIPTATAVGGFLNWSANTQMKGVIKWNPSIGEVISSAPLSIQAAMAASHAKYGGSNTKEFKDAIEDRDIPSYGIKKVQTYDLISLQDAGIDDYHWFSTLDEAKASGLGPISAFSVENKFWFESRITVVGPTIQLISDEGRVVNNMVDGEYTTLASDFYVKDGDGWKHASGHVPHITPTQYDSSGMATQLQSPAAGSGQVGAHTLRLIRRMYSIQPSTDNVNIKLSGDVTTPVRWDIGAVSPAEGTIGDDSIRVKVDTPKGVGIVPGTVRLLGKESGKSLEVEIVGDNNLDKDRMVEFKIPSMIGDSQYELIYEIYMDETIADIDSSKFTYSSGDRYARIYWSGHDEETYAKESNVNEAALKYAAPYSILSTIARKTAIIDAITPARGEVNSEHTVKVKPYTTLDTPESGVKVLTALPIEGFHGSIKLAGVTTEAKHGYDVYYTDKVLTEKDPNKIPLNSLTRYTGGDVSAKHVLIVVKDQLTMDDKVEFDLKIKTSGNQGGDIYDYQSTGNTDVNYKVPFTSNKVRHTVFSRNIKGRVFEDTNKDGLIGEGEQLFSEKTLELVKDGKVIATTKTNAKGEYEFKGVPAGNHTVRLKSGTFDASYELTKLAASANNGNKAIGTAQDPRVENISLPAEIEGNTFTSDYHNIGVYLNNVRITNPEKKVSDLNEKGVDRNNLGLSDRNQSYTISFNTSKGGYLAKLIVTDKMAKEFTPSGKIVVRNSAGQDVTNHFDYKFEGNTLTASVKDASRSEQSLINTKISIEIPGTATRWLGGIIKNQATVSDFEADHETNETLTVVPKDGSAIKEVSVDDNESFSKAETDETAAIVASTFDEYVWRKTFTLPNYTEYTKVVINDTFESVQKLDVARIRVTDETGKDVTSLGELKTEKLSDSQTKITWTGGANYLTELNKAHGATKESSAQLTLSIPTDVSEASADQLNAYMNADKKVIIPNVASIMLRDNSGVDVDYKMDTNVSKVSVPSLVDSEEEGKPTKTVSDSNEKSVTQNHLGFNEVTQTYTVSATTAGGHTIEKLVIRDEMPVEFATALDKINLTNGAGEDVTSLFDVTLNGNVATATLKDSAKSNDKVIATQVNLHIAGNFPVGLGKSVVNKATVSDHRGTYETGEVKTYIPSTPESTKYVSVDGGQTFVDAATLAKRSDEYIWKVDHKLANHTEYSSIVITDELEGIQEVDANKIKVFGSDGSDITGQGKLDLSKKSGKVLVTWTAGKEFLDATNKAYGPLSADTPRMSMTIATNVREALNSDEAKYFNAETGKVEIPNVGGMKLTSTTAGETTVKTNTPKVSLPTPGESSVKKFVAKDGDNPQWSDKLQLTNFDEVYQYRTEFKLADNFNFDSGALVLRDAYENIQYYDKVVMTDASGADITSKFDITVEQESDEQGQPIAGSTVQITAVPKRANDFDDKGEVVNMVIKGAKLTGATGHQLAGYISTKDSEGGFHSGVTVPNVSTMTSTSSVPGQSQDRTSNKTYVNFDLEARIEKSVEDELTQVVNPKEATSETPLSDLVASAQKLITEPGKAKKAALEKLQAALTNPEVTPAQLLTLLIEASK